MHTPKLKRKAYSEKAFITFSNEMIHSRTSAFAFIVPIPYIVTIQSEICGISFMLHTNAMCLRDKER